jgi:hypothetical protein
LVNAGFVDYDEKANESLKSLIEQYKPIQLHSKI